uniref:Variable surface glycoprotein n=1 Tax=Trypanosoma congolense TaxID=5692 RepID=Q26977_TRYCO|nr:variable surface glycoprotein [Trypanosoma congolense]
MIKVLLTLLSVAVCQKGLTSGELDNVQEFGILCRIYQIASTTVPEASSAHDGQMTKLMKDISDIVLSTTANDSYYEAESTKITPNIKEHCKRISASSQTQPLVRKMRRILARASARAAELGSLGKEDQSARDTIRKALLKAIYGKDVDTQEDGEAAVRGAEAPVFGDQKSKLGSNGDKNCGGSGGPSTGEHVGVSLVNDFFCLCIAGGHSAGDKWCHISIAKASANKNWASLTGHDTEWGKIKTNCPRFSVNLTASAIDQALMAFHSRLGGGGKGTPNGDSGQQIGGYIFGKTGTLATGCTGDDGQVCLNYKKNLVPESNGKIKGIDWEKRLREASWELRQIEERKREGEVLLTQLEMLNHSAWETCLEAWDRVEDERSSSTKVSGSPEGDKGTTKTPISNGSLPINSSGVNRGKRLSAFSSYLLVIFA